MYEYTYDYSICSLIFLTIVAAHFFSKRQFPNLQNRIFAATLLLSLADIVLDIGSSLLIEHANERFPHGRSTCSTRRFTRCNA